MKVGFLHSLVRKEEKLLLQEFRRREGVELVMMDDRDIGFKVGENEFGVDILIERCINHSRALMALRLFKTAGVKCVNDYEVALTCGDKLLTASALEDAGVPQPEVRVAFTEKSALKEIEEMGYPV